MTDELLTPQDEGVVTDFMVSGLAVGPAQSTAVLLAKARTRHQRHRIMVASLAAALLLCLYAASPLVLPALARALSAMPGVGSSFEQALKMHSLNLAYEAGLLPTLDKSVERDGVTLTVHTAYRDSQTFDLLLSISGEPDLFKTLSEGIGPRVELSSRWWKAKGSNFNKLYDEEDGRLYVAISSSDPLPWYVRELSVRVQWMVNEAEIQKYKSGVLWNDVELSEPLMVSFPLQRVTGKNTQVVPINQTIVSDGTTVRLTSLAFNPVRTILKFTYTGNEPVLQLLDENGASIRLFTMGGDPNAGYVNGAATGSKAVTVRFKGCRMDYKVEVPLQVGYEYRGEPSFRIESVTPTKEWLPWLNPDKEYYADTKVVLSWDQNKWGSVQVERGVADWTRDKMTLLLLREGQPENQPMKLTFSRLEGEPQEIQVTR